MTPEQLGKTIEFLLEHQARFSSDMDQLKQAQTRLETNQEQLQADLKALTDITAKLAVRQMEMIEQANYDRQALQSQMQRFEEQADADRRIMREVVQD